MPFFKFLENDVYGSDTMGSWSFEKLPKSGDGRSGKRGGGGGGGGGGVYGRLRIKTTGDDITDGVMKSVHSERCEDTAKPQA